MKLHGFISRLQELNAYLEEFPPDTEGQETAPLPTDEIMDIIYHSMPTIWKYKMIEQGFNYLANPFYQPRKKFWHEINIWTNAYHFLNTCM